MKKGSRKLTSITRTTTQLRWQKNTTEKVKSLNFIAESVTRLSSPKIKLSIMKSQKVIKKMSRLYESK